MSSAIADSLPNSSPRRWYWAALWSLLCPGLGQIYATRVPRGLKTMAAAAMLQGTGLVISVQSPTKPLFVAVMTVAALYLGFYAFAIIDAILCARREKEAFLGAWNRAGIYIGIVLAWSVATQVAGFAQENAKQMANFSIPANSMAPTLLPGDYLTARKTFRQQNPPQRGDVVVFNKKGTPVIPYVKRLVGLPGDRVQLRDGRLYLNDFALPQTPDAENIFIETMPNGRSYRVQIDNRGHFSENTPVYTVPAGHYFVLGDNRENSADSRFLDEVGFIPEEALTGKALFLFWSNDLARIGTELE